MLATEGHMDLTKWEPVGGLVRWKPAFCGLEEIVEGGDRMLTTTFFEKPPARERLTKIDWRPSVDIQELSGEYLIEVELSGVKKEDLSVTVEEGSLVIRGERRKENGNGARLHRTERPHGSFLRSFALPADADSGRITAESLDGILKIRVPKAPLAKRGAVQIKIG